MILDFTTLQIVWWVIVSFVIATYAATAGFDFGTTLMLPFFRNEDDRRVMLDVIVPTWEGNQVWIIFAGGALFVIWPVVYSTVFSGLYALILFILWPFFLRPLGFDYRGKIPHARWRSAWDFALFISAFFPVLMFGLAFGNLLMGLPIHFDAFDLRSYYDGNFLNLLSPFGILCAVASLFMCLMHGAALLHRRTEASLKIKFKSLHRLFSILFLMTFTAGGWMLAHKVNGYLLIHSPVNPTAHPLNNEVSKAVGHWFEVYKTYPWKFMAPLLTYTSVIVALLTTDLKQGAISFWASVVAVVSTVVTVGSTLFPFLVPSSTNPNQSLTVWNASSEQYTLMAMFYVLGVLLLITFFYKLVAYGIIWRRKKTLNSDDLEKKNSSFY